VAIVYTIFIVWLTGMHLTFHLEAFIVHMQILGKYVYVGLSVPFRGWHKQQATRKDMKIRANQILLRLHVASNIDNLGQICQLTLL